MYKQKNPGKVKAWRAARNARKRGAEGRWTASDWAEILGAHNHCCAHCKVEFSEDFTASVDHIVPLSKGGSNWPSNLQPLCVPCNRKKGATC